MRKTAENVEFHLLDQLPVGICFVNEDGRMMYWNQAAEQVSGFSISEVLGRSCMDVLVYCLDESGDRPCDVWGDMARAVDEQRIWEQDLWLRRASGDVIAVTVKILPDSGRNGNAGSFVKILSERSVAMAQGLAHRDRPSNAEML